MIRRSRQFRNPIPTMTVWVFSKISLIAASSARCAMLGLYPKSSSLILKFSLSRASSPGSFFLKILFCHPAAGGAGNLLLSFPTFGIIYYTEESPESPTSKGELPIMNSRNCQLPRIPHDSLRLPIASAFPNCL